MIVGLSYIPDFVSETEQEDLLSVIDAAPWRTDLKRRTQHYGYRYDYTKKSIDHSMSLGPLPVWLEYLTTKLVKESIFTQPIDQVIVNEYLPGQGISRHIDCVPCFGDTIASLSLGSTCSMEFEHIKSFKKGSILLASRSLLVLSDEARYDWMHSIPARKQDPYEDTVLERIRRVSLTFRTIKHER